MKNHTRRSVIFAFLSSRYINIFLFIFNIAKWKILC